MSTPMETNTANLREVLGAVNALPDVGALAVLYTSAQNLSDAQKERARSNIGALAESELDNAVNDALEQAKESGEFKGDPGAGVKSMTYNNSTNKWTVTLTNNSTITVDGPAIPDVSAYMPKSGGTFTGQVVAGSSNQAVGTSLLRNSKLVSSESYPSTNGEINWQYE